MVLPFAGKMGLVLLRDERLESSAGRQLCKSTHRKELKANVCSRQQCSLSQLCFYPISIQIMYFSMYYQTCVLYV